MWVRINCWWLFSLHFNVNSNLIFLFLNWNFSSSYCFFWESKSRMEWNRMPNVNIIASWWIVDNEIRLKNDFISPLLLSFHQQLLICNLTSPQRVFSKNKGFEAFLCYGKFFNGVYITYIERNKISRNMVKRGGERE